MNNKLKKIIRSILPYTFRKMIYEFIPKFQETNTYLIKRSELINGLQPISKNYSIKELEYEDSEKVIVAYGKKGSAKQSILKRLKDPAWVGLAVIESTTQDIAYISWIIRENTPFINEFGIYLSKKQYFLRHGYCVPRFRHQGLHTRMEQERINFSIRNGANEMFIQIGSKNLKGQKSVLENRFEFYQKDIIVRIPRIGVYRELKSFLRNPLKRII